MHSLKHTTIYEITFDCSISHKSEDQLVKQHPPYYRTNSNSSTPSGSPKNLIAYQQQQQQKRTMDGASPVIDHRTLMGGPIMRSNSNSSTTLAMVSQDTRERGWSGNEYDLYSPATSTASITSMTSPSMAGRPIGKAKSSPVVTYEASPGGTYHTGPLAYQAVNSPVYTQPPSANSSTTQRLLKTNTLNRMRMMDGLAIPNPPTTAYANPMPPNASSPVASQAAAHAAASQSAFPLAAPQNMPFQANPTHINPAVIAQHRRVAAATTAPPAGVTNQSATQLEDILSNLRINTTPGTEASLPATYPHAGTPTSLHSSPTYRNNNAGNHPSYSTMTNSTSSSASGSTSQYGQFATPPSPWWEQQQATPMAPMMNPHTQHLMNHSTSADYEVMHDPNYSLPTTTSLPHHPHHMHAVSNAYTHVQHQYPPQQYLPQQPIAGNGEYSGMYGQQVSGGYEGMMNSSSHQMTGEYLDANAMSSYNVFAPSAYSSNDSSKLSSPTAHFSKSPTSANISKISSPTASMSTTVSTVSEASSVVTTTFPAATTEGVVSLGSGVEEAK